jgi:hypothetical protein
MLYGKRFMRNLKAIYEGKEKFIWASNAFNELYDLEKDPGEQENLIAKSPPKAQVMQKMLQKYAVSITPSKVKRETVKIDKSTEEKLRALGYVR